MLAWIHQTLASERELLCQVLSVTVPEAVRDATATGPTCAYPKRPQGLTRCRLLAPPLAQEGSLATPKAAVERSNRPAGFTEEDR